MDWFKPRRTQSPADRRQVPQVPHDGAAPWFPIPSGRDTRPYSIWLTGTKDFTLHNIAQQAYGLPDLWPKIAAANPRIDPFAVPAGHHLVIPHHWAGDKPQQRPRNMKRRRQTWAR